MHTRVHARPARYALRRLAGALAVGLLGLTLASLPACRRNGEVNGGGSGAALPWTWQGGANTVNSAPTFGTPGAGVSGDVPGARDGAATWRDASGNLWLFGGHGIDSTGASQGVSLDDLWEYSPSLYIWTFVGGSQIGNAASTYVAQGQASSSNFPGARVGATSWTDGLGNFWLFGGVSSAGALNELWEYTPSSGSGSGAWTFVSGSTSVDAPGIYGTLGSAGTGGSFPGARSYASGWVDNQGNFWLYGGQGYDSLGSPGYLGDLWMYSTQLHAWAWMGGPKSANPAGTYTATAQASVAPGGRISAMTWGSGTNTIWLFGGTGYDGAGDPPGLLNDLWQLTLGATPTWKFVAGSTAIDATAVYGALGVGATGNTPQARAGGLSATDAQGRLLLFGGDGQEATVANGPAGQYAVNDVWRFDPSANQWTWLGGAQLGNAPGSYGTRGQQASSNLPGARASMAAWTDKGGNVWLFGGAGVDGSGNLGDLGDLWEVVP